MESEPQPTSVSPTFQVGLPAYTNMTIDLWNMDIGLARALLNTQTPFTLYFGCKETGTAFWVTFTPLKGLYLKLPGTDNSFTNVAIDRVGSYPFKLSKGEIAGVGYVASKFGVHDPEAYMIHCLFRWLSGEEEDEHATS